MNFTLTVDQEIIRINAGASYITEPVLNLTESY